MAGVGIGGALETCAFYANADAITYIDINPAITHVIVPVMGILIMESENRAAYSKKLLSTDRNTLDVSNHFGHFNTAVLYENIERAFKTISPYLEGDEQRFAKKKIGEYLTSFAVIGNDHLPMGYLMGSYWSSLLFEKFERGSRFWLATEEGWNCLKQLWEKGMVFGLNSDLAAPALADNAPHFFLTTCPYHYFIYPMYLII